MEELLHDAIYNLLLTFFNYFRRLVCTDHVIVVSIQKVVVKLVVRKENCLDAVVQQGLVVS